MLTVSEALQLPPFSETQLVAGASGLEREIRWVHTIDIPDANYEYQRPGILLLTAGFGLHNNTERQAQLIPKLVAEGFAGLVLSVGWYLEEVPHIMKQVADELGFPIVVSPPDVLFIHLTEAILDQIVNRQYKLLQQANDVYNQLTDLVLQGGGLADLADRLSQLINRSILIEDSTLRVLAQAESGPIDEMRRQSVVHGRTSPEVSQYLFKTGVYAQLRHSLKPVHVLPIPDMGATLHRVVVPIVVDREIYGYLWIITDETTQEFDLLAAGHGATVAALIMFKERAVQEAEAALRGDFFEQLLQGDLHDRPFREQARRLNFRPDAAHQIIIVHGPPHAGGNARPLLRDVSEWQQRRGYHLLGVWYNEQVALIVENEDGYQLAQQLFRELSHPARPLLLGVGSHAHTVADIKNSYNSAWETIHIGRILGQQSGVMDFKELGLYHWLYHLPPEQLSGNIYLQFIEKLAGHDFSRNTELIKTLEGYLDHGGNLVETALKLHIHRNTLVHRVRRIEELLEINLRDPLSRLNLHVAVKQYRLQQGQPGP